MKISWNSLNQFIDLKNINILNITEKLTLAGLEVESATFNRIISDTILDISLTTNRQDLKGLIHIANELSALLQKTLKVSNQYSQTTKGLQVYKIKDLNLANTNHNIERYLKLLEIDTTYTILDKINFINFKWGQQFKAYTINFPIIEENSLSQFGINIDKNQKIYCDTKILQEINTKNNKLKQNIQDIILINYKKTNQFPDYTYKDLFDVLEINKKQIILIYEFINKKHKEIRFNHTIECKLEKINNILGPLNQNHDQTKLTNEQIIDTLKQLNFQVHNTNNILNIEIPEERKNDIQSDIDIVEEIGRLHGFNNFIDNVPYFHETLVNSSISQLKQKIRRILRSNGLHEIINYSFQGQANKNHYYIINPLNQDQVTLRNNLIENLITTIKHNSYQNNKPFEVFEIGNVFFKQSSNTANKESIHLCSVISNETFNQLNWQDKKNCLSWYQAKGQIEEFFEKLNAQILWSTKPENNYFIRNISQYIHPTKSIYIKYQKQTIGILSQLNYRINHIIGLNQTIYFFEIDIIKLSNSIFKQKHLKYKYLPYANYPKMARDLSIIVKKTISMENISNIIYPIQKDFNYMIESIKILNDYYHTNQSRNICLRINYRSLKKTLTNSEVEILNNKFKETLYNRLESKT